MKKKPVPTLPAKPTPPAKPVKRITSRTLLKWGKDYGLIVIALGLLAIGVEDHYDIRAIRDSLLVDAAQNAQIKLLWDREVLAYNRLNATRAQVRPPLYQFPYEPHP